MSTLKALMPALCIVVVMIIADALLHPSSVTLISATALATAVAYTRGSWRSRRVDARPAKADLQPRSAGDY